LKASLQDFERAGLALSEEDGAKLKQLLEQDAAVCAEYGKNLGADTTKILFTPEELQGCGDDFIQERLNDDDEAAAGKYCTITLKYCDIIPIGTNCEVSETRWRVVEAREGVTAYQNNLDLVAQGIGLRKQIATLLGFESWAEYIICSTRMSGSYQAVDEFLTSIHTQRYGKRKLRNAAEFSGNSLVLVETVSWLCRGIRKTSRFTDVLLLLVLA
jgi:Zn-dependent oligopeptidase